MKHLHTRYTTAAEDVPLETLARIGAALFADGLTSDEYRMARETLSVSQIIGVLIWFRW